MEAKPFAIAKKTIGNRKPLLMNSFSERTMVPENILVRDGTSNFCGNKSFLCKNGMIVDNLQTANIVNKMIDDGYCNNCIQKVIF